VSLDIVVGEKLDELTAPFARRCFDPRGHVRMGPAAASPRQRLVRDVAREYVLEGELLLAGDGGAQAGPDEVPFLEPAEGLLELVGLAVQQGRDRSVPEDPPDHGRLLQDTLVALVE
jgi:hypothetical protein